MDMTTVENIIGNESNEKIEGTNFANPNVKERCTLNGTISLHYEKRVYSFENHRRKLVNVEKKDFPFQIASEEELMKMRIDGKKLFILYKKGFRFYAEIPEISFGAFSSIGKTVCTFGNECCQHLLPIPTNLGGCDKVYDLPLGRYLALDYTFKELFEFGKRIDKYPFITEGFETCNIPIPVFVVLKCKNCTLD